MPNRKDTSTKRIGVTVSEEEAGFRADRALAVLVPSIGRRASKTFFHQGHIRLNGAPAQGSEKVRQGDLLEYPDPDAEKNRELFHHTAAPRLTTPHGRHITRLYEDDALLVISKPAEIPVHRGQGGFTKRDTLEDVLERAYPPRTEDGTVVKKPAKKRPPGRSGDCAAIPKGEPGFYLVHRLDMETSGCLLVAKSRPVLEKLVTDFSERNVEKAYWALVVGEVPWQKKVVQRPIAYERAEKADAKKPAGKSKMPDWVERKRTPKVMKGVKKGKAVEEGDIKGKASETHFQVKERFKGYTLLRCEPKTGRTHQIRVHLKSEGYPLAYDPLYARSIPLRMREFDGRTADLTSGEEIVLNRLPLHAARLAFNHPTLEKRVEAKAELPRDLRDFLRLLRKFRSTREKTDGKAWGKGTGKKKRGNRKR